MAFCSFSKDVDNAYAIIENKFITKYLPDADGFAVKVYLYGLYLCQNTDADFSVSAMAEVLNADETKIVEAFDYWEDYDLVEILCRNPLTVQYLPVRSAVGRPKKIRYEQYADFNKELQRKMQKVKKFISAGDYVKYMRFLEENAIQPQAFLLIVEYCINKQGENVSPSYIFNKAKKLLRGGVSTYEQVEKALSNYNAHEGELTAVFNALSVYGRTPDESDYAAYEKWTETLGFDKHAVLAAAKKLKRGTINSLDLTLGELAEKGKMAAKEIEQYLTERDFLANLTFRIGRKLGVKVANPAAYIDEYVEVWYNYGFEENSLLDLALFCMKAERGSFPSMHELVQKLFGEGVVAQEGVKEFLKEKNSDLKLFDKIRTLCGAIRKNEANLALIKTWREWGFHDEMILEAAKRSAVSANPVPYLNKILSDWKRANIYDVKDIPENGGTGNASAPTKTGYINPAVEAANAKAARERYYALLREKAQAQVDKFYAKANANPRFKEISTELSKMEIALAKAEVFEPATLPVLNAQKRNLLAERKQILGALEIKESDLTLKFLCKKCSDTGFLPNGASCNCYQPD